MPVAWIAKYGVLFGNPSRLDFGSFLYTLRPERSRWRGGRLRRDRFWKRVLIG
jgi:hypothetical protein